MSNESVSPERLLALVHGYAASQIVSCAARFSFFTQIARGRSSAADIAAAARTDPHGTRKVLDACVALQLLTRRDGHYGLTPVADEFLVEGRSNDLSGAVAALPGLHWDAWSHLGDLLASGRRERDLSSVEQAGTFFPHLVRAILPLGLGPADRTAEHFGVGAERSGVRVLDIGAGGAAWSIPFARRDPESRITAFDLPSVLVETRKIVAEQGVADRYEFEEGDLLRADFGLDRYDFAILGNICHGLSPEQNRDLFTRIRPALVTGGRLLVVDMLPNEERTGPTWPVLFAVTMYVMGGSDTYPLSDYDRWLRAAGFTTVDTFDTERSHSPVLVAGA